MTSKFFQLTVSANFDRFMRLINQIFNFINNNITYQTIIIGYWSGGEVEFVSLQVQNEDFSVLNNLSCT